MLDGWYCRTLANEQAQTDNNEQNIDVHDDTDSSDSQENDESRQDGQASNMDYKTQYRYLKRKLKFLIYENEFFQDALRSNQRRLLKVSRDRAFLLDRLLQYEKPENTSESEETEESSDDDATKEMKRRKSEQGAASATGAPRGRKKKVMPAITSDISETKSNQTLSNLVTNEHNHSHAEVEIQLSKRPVIELVPERTVPHEMFSNEHEPSPDSEPTDHLVECSSPTHVAAEECVPMEYSN